MNIIVMTAFCRPDYFATVIQGLSNCLGIEKYKVIVCLDGGFPEAQEKCLQILNKSTLFYETRVRKENIGLNRNTYEALEIGFEYNTDWIILLEDDVLPSRDFLIYMEKMLNELEEEKSLFSVSGYCPSLSIIPSRQVENAGIVEHWRTKINIPYYSVRTPYSIGLWEWNCTWGLGLWKSRWDKTIQKNLKPESHILLDCQINFHCRKNRLSVFPMMSRVQNIGENHGLSQLSYTEYRNEHYTENLYTGDPIQDFEIEPVKQFLQTYKPTKIPFSLKQQLLNCWKK